jgi:hypothetical protein
VQAGSLRSPGTSVSEILEVCGDAEIAAAHKRNHRLQVVTLLSGDADLSLLKLALDLEVLPFDGVNYFLGLVPLETLLDFQLLPGVAQG